MYALYMIKERACIDIACCAIPFICSCKSNMFKTKYIDAIFYLTFIVLRINRYICTFLVDIFKLRYQLSSNQSDINITTLLSNMTLEWCHVTKSSIKISSFICFAPNGVIIAPRICLHESAFQMYNVKKERRKHSAQVHKYLIDFLIVDAAYTCIYRCSTIMNWQTVT